MERKTPRYIVIVWKIWLFFFFFSVLGCKGAGGEVVGDWGVYVQIPKCTQFVKHVM